MILSTLKFPLHRSEHLLQVGIFHPLFKIDLSPWKRAIRPDPRPVPLWLSFLLGKILLKRYILWNFSEQSFIQTDEYFTTCACVMKEEAFIENACNQWKIPASISWEICEVKHMTNEMRRKSVQWTILWQYFFAMQKRPMEFRTLLNFVCSNTTFLVNLGIFIIQFFRE